MLKNIGEIMSNVKTQTSKSYREFVINLLQTPDNAASYIETALEADNLEPELLLVMLKDVVNSRKQLNEFSQEAQLYFDRLEKLLIQSGGTEIYTAIAFLNALEFRVEIKPDIAYPHPPNDVSNNI
ncbi:MAG: transcriptional regulator [Cyanobacteria bacterium P01_E01_bin.42]